METVGFGVMVLGPEREDPPVRDVLNILFCSKYMTQLYKFVCNLNCAVDTNNVHMPDRTILLR